MISTIAPTANHTIQNRSRFRPSGTGALTGPRALVGCSGGYEVGGIVTGRKTLLALARVAILLLPRTSARAAQQIADRRVAAGQPKCWLPIQATKATGGAMESSNRAAPEARLRAAMDERRKASIKGDTEKIASSLADEYLQTDISGYVQDKTTWLNEYFKPLAELIKAGKFRWEVYDRKDRCSEPGPRAPGRVGTLMWSQFGHRAGGTSELRGPSHCRLEIAVHYAALVHRDEGVRRACGSTFTATSRPRRRSRAR